MADGRIALDLKTPISTLNGGRVRLLRVRGLPDGVTLSAGSVDDGDAWVLSPDDLDGLMLLYPGTFGDFRLDVEAVLETGDGDSEPPLTLTVKVPGTRKTPQAVNSTPPSDTVASAVNFEAEIMDLETAKTHMEKLRQVIDTLRGDLEETSNGTSDAIESTISATEEESASLKAHVSELRDEMEQLRRDREQAIKDAVMERAEEIAVLKEKAGQIRDALEDLRNQGSRDREDAVRDTKAEIAALKARVGRLRDEAEAKAGAYREKEGALRAENEETIRTLKAAIFGLRDRLEEIRE